MTAPSTPPPNPPRLLRRKIAAILAADVAGYSRLVAESEEETLHALAAAREIFDELVRGGGGRIFNTAGDSVMCEFDSAVEAVRTAVAIQTAMGERNAGAPPRRRLEYRMGLTIGDVVERGGDLLGDGVNIAARLESLAPAGGICVSRSVHEAVANKISAVFRDIGQRTVKNLPQPIHAFVYEPPRPDPGTAAQPSAALPAGADFMIGAAPGHRREPVPRERPERGSATVARPMLLIGAAALLGWFGYEPASRWLLSAEQRSTEQATLPDIAAKPESRTPPGASTPSSMPPGTIPGRPADPPRSAVTGPVPPAESGKATEAKPVETRPVETRPAETRSAEPKAAEKPFTPAEQPAAFAALAREGIVADASSPAELYHNARLQEARDRPAALRSYAALLGRTGDFLDADLRFASLARSAGTAATARAALTGAARQTKSPAPALAAAGLADPADRRKRLETLVAGSPDYAAAAYLLAEDYLSGTPSLTERRLAFDAFGSFLEGAAGRATEAAFMDKATLAGWRETARRRLGEIEASFTNAATRPTATFARADGGWSATVTLPEPVQSATLRIGEKGEERSATPPNAGTGRGGTRVAFDLPGGQARTTLYVGYTDLTGHAAGPFPIAFDPTAALAAAEKDTLERYPDSWLTFRADIPDIASYRQLVSNRCAIGKATVGFDGGVRNPLPLPPCDEVNPFTVPADTQPVITLPSGADRVDVQLTYTDGTQSVVRSFGRPAGADGKAKGFGGAVGNVIEFGKGIGGNLGGAVGGLLGGGPAKPERD